MNETFFFIFYNLFVLMDHELFNGLLSTYLQILPSKVGSSDNLYWGWCRVLILAGTPNDLMFISVTPDK
jgi:hypothetical protein